MPDVKPARPPRKPGLYERYFKRLFDVSASLAGLIILSPLILVVAFLVRIKLGSPVLFKQIRPGYQGRPFAILKFRTMTDERDEKGDLLPDEVRLKPFGIWLRRLSLDELPQLINVVRGDVSLVGPRPLLMSYLDIYTPEQARRHDVQPGITGLAQVNGRNAISWEEKFRWDIKYVDELSFWMDMGILFKTVGKVLGSHGISQPGHATMGAFTATTSTTSKFSSMYALPELLRSLLITEADWNVVPRPVQAAIVLLVERMQTLERRVAASENMPAGIAVVTPVETRRSDFEDEPRTQPIDVPALIDDEDITRPTGEPAAAGVQAKRDGTISSNQEREIVAIEEMMDVTREVRYSPEEITKILEEDTASASTESTKVPARIRK